MCLGSCCRCQCQPSSPCGKMRDVGARVDVLVAVVHTMHWCIFLAGPKYHVPVGRGRPVVRDEDCRDLLFRRMVVTAHITVRCSCEAEVHVVPCALDVLVRKVLHLPVLGDERGAVRDHAAQLVKHICIEVRPEVQTAALLFGVIIDVKLCELWLRSLISLQCVTIVVESAVDHAHRRSVLARTWWQLQIRPEGHHRHRRVVATNRIAEALCPPAAGRAQGAERFRAGRR